MRKFRAWDKGGEKRYLPDEFIGQLFLRMDGKIIWYSAEGLEDVTDKFDIEFSTGLKDKQGKEIWHQDIKRTLRLEPIFELLGEPQNGESQVDTKIHVNNVIIDFVEEIANNFLTKQVGGDWSASEVFDAFGLPDTIPQDEIQECILDPIASYGIICKTVKEVAEYINKGEIIGDIHTSPELLE